MLIPHAHCAPKLRAPGREKHPLVPVENRQKQISSAELAKYDMPDETRERRPLCAWLRSFRNDEIEIALSVC